MSPGAHVQGTVKSPTNLRDVVVNHLGNYERLGNFSPSIVHTLAAAPLSNLLIFDDRYAEALIYASHLLGIAPPIHIFTPCK